MAVKKKQALPSAPKQNFPIVGIGSSSGGLDAFKRLLEAIPFHSGMAYILIQQLSPAHPNLTAETVSGYTGLPVTELTDEIIFSPDHVYIVPENSMITAVDGILKLSGRDPSKKEKLIDIFLISLAEVHKSFARGVVFSGVSYDGIQGLKTVKEYGGVTFTQDPSSVIFDGTPKSVIDAAMVDFVLSPEEIPDKLSEVNAAYETNHAHEEAAPIPKDDEDAFRHIIRMLRLRTGNDFTHYKPATIRRRIARRMVITKTDELSEYLTYLRNDKKEQDVLFDDILIPVTYFFRDPKTFQRLTDSVFPALFANKTSGKTIRVWVAGCSTGQEAYSIAICLHEFLGDRLPGIKVQIFASDISESVITTARAAVYTKQDLQNVSDARLQEYFTKNNGLYHINKNIRDMCIFAVHNFVKDPPFTNVDLITCRNVLIYMDMYLQKKALTTFHYALNENGTLVLGISETTSQVSNLFTPQVRHDKIYSRITVPGKIIRENQDRPEFSKRSYIPGPAAPTRPDFQKIAYDILVSRYTPCCVIVNEHNDIVHVHGDTSAYLIPSPGKPNFNVLKMARETLSFELRNALHKAKTSVETVRKEAIPISIHDKEMLVDLEIVPLPNSVDPHFLIIFRQTRGSDLVKPVHTSKDASQLRIEQLENELAQLRQDIVSITEDQEAVNEELQSANEELLSSTEELQTLNEELETSTEELRSNNEELMNVNEELLERQNQLTTAKHYAEAIVTTIREPLIIIDENMQVRNANPAFYRYFGIAEKDIENSSIFKLSNGQWDLPELRTSLENILSGKHSLEDYEITINIPSKGDCTLLVNAQMIRNDKSSEQLILLAVEDITVNKVASLLRESEERFRTVIDTAPVLLWLSVDKSYSFFNKAWLEFGGKKIEDEKNDGWMKRIHPEDKKNYLKVFNEAYNERAEFYAEYRLQRADGEYRWIVDHGTPRFNQKGDFVGYVGGCVDIQHQKDFSGILEAEIAQHTEELKILNERLISKNAELEDNNAELASFSFVASHDLQEPLRKIDTFVKMISDKEGTILSDTAKDYLHRVSISVNRMKELIHALLEYSRTNTQKEPLKKVSFNLVLDEVEGELKESIEEKKALIEVDSLPSIPAVTHQLKQLFTNLIGNALKYSKADVPPRINISSALVSVPGYGGKFWKVTVADNGIGFEQQYEKKIFELFQRLHGKGEYNGTGIGLGICKKIMLNHNGFINAEGTPGVGSSFHVFFPE